MINKKYIILLMLIILLIFVVACSTNEAQTKNISHSTDMNDSNLDGGENITQDIVEISKGVDNIDSTLSDLDDLIE